MQLAGKSAIVTGAGRGIGLAIATEMVRSGARVVLVDHESEPLQSAVAALVAQGHTVSACTADVATPEGNQQVVSHALNCFGIVDIFFANAGVAPFADLLQSTRAQIDRTIATNLAGAIYGCAAVLPHMVARRSGVILLTASIAAYVGDPSVPVYSATKGGLTALCRNR